MANIHLVKQLQLVGCRRKDVYSTEGKTPICEVSNKKPFSTQIACKKIVIPSCIGSATPMALWPV